MLRTMNLRNFKSWRQIQGMEFGRITGLFGGNSSGKTSILQVLLMLKQTVDSSDRAQVLSFGGERGLVDLSSFRDTVFRHQADTEMSWALRWQLPQTLSIANPRVEGETLFEDDSLNFSARIRESEQELLYVRSMSYGFANAEFGMRMRENEPGQYDLAYQSEAPFRFVRVRGRAWPLPQPNKFYGFPDQVAAYYRNADLLSDLELALEQQFSGLFYLGPLREAPRHEYAWSGSQPQDMGQKGERVVDALLASRQRGVKIRRGYKKRRVTVEERVAEWLRELGLVHSFSVDRIAPESNLYQVKVRKTAASAPVLITDVGFGVSQILPIIALCYYVPEGSTILLEQPEIHLHPRVQSGLADVFIDAVRTRNIQVIVESHSEHLLRRLQTRYAESEGDMTSEDMQLYFCEHVRTESQLTPLEFDEFGVISNWPPYFFGDLLGEAAATARARAKRIRSDHE